MKLSTAESIPIDVFVLILDRLPLRDLGSFQAAYSQEPRMSKIAKWRSLLRLCNLFTKGSIQLCAVIDGQNQYWKINRDEPFRQRRIKGRAEPTRPFRPFTPQTKFDRIFTGTRGNPKMGLRLSEGTYYSTMYQPIDWTGSPAEVVLMEISFTLGGEIIRLEYDTGRITVPKVEATYSEDGECLYRTINHRLPLIKAICGEVENGIQGGYELPKDWIEFLGNEAFVNVTFMEHMSECHIDLNNIWKGRATMQSFEMDWNVKLHEWCCTSDVIDIWHGRSTVHSVEVAQQKKPN